ncbi:extracellular solute-binding protein [Rhizobacter sp. SG703]|uniref:ABC transporter substrate-binding protein n=1 Tax=Rhizobacter sp. SG703 TaxID=2587140 RepID=UPI0014468404|nr:extracellular solute-binding protein [Rhizobacter sp. SG703]NKI92504.1 raffinose/stachyose/melibiose transport system substrate-binding protein [Rhizobacter sp. SG703]
MKRTVRTAFACTALALAASAQAGSLVIESWRTDDKALWDEVLLPAFMKSHPGITVKYSPTSPPEYNSVLSARLSAGSAGDLVACRPFDVSLDLYKKGRLLRLDGDPALANFSDVAKVAWQTDDFKESYCLPMASVIHGFFYNKKIFADAGVKPPATEAEFFSVLDRVKAQGKVAPIALGTADQWESNQIVFTGIGPNYWKGEVGRMGLIAGAKKFTDPEFVDVWSTMAKWSPYLPKGYQSVTYGDAQNLFASGKAAVYPAGSWDIAYFEKEPGFEFGAFPPPVRKAGDACYISDHNDIGMGINKASRNVADAKVFLGWLATKEFADLYTNKATGFFSLSKHPVEVKDPVAREMIGWRAQCKSTIRLNAQVLSRGEPSMENELWTVNSQVLNGKLAPKDAAQRIQAGFAKWYPPQQKK